MRTLAAIAAACVIAGWPAIHAQPTPQQDFERLPFAPRRAICYRVPAVLRIDGRLSEAAWNAVPWSDPFVDIDGTRRPPLGTRMKMRWDDDHFKPLRRPSSFARTRTVRYASRAPQGGA